MVLLDGALLVESRLLLTDSVLFFFELLQLYAMARVRAAPLNSASGVRWLFVCGFSIAAAVSTKWTALATMGIVGLESVRSLLGTLHGCVLARDSTWRRAHRALDAPSAWRFNLPVLGKSLLPLASEFGLRLVALLLVPALFYYASFVLHFHFLPHSGPGDKFHTADFRCMLDGPPVASPWELKHCSYKGCAPCASLTAPTTWGAVRALNAEMLSANAHIKTGHAFGSGWAGWPLGSTPVFYWQEAHQGMWCKIYMAANPVIWRAALALCALLVLMLVHDMASLVLAMPTRYASAEARLMHRRFILNGWLLLIGYLVAWLPFAMVERVAFLYHYIPPLLLTFLGAGIAFDLVTVRLARLRPFRPFVHYGR